MRTFVFAFALGAAAACATAARAVDTTPVPPGWKLIKDRKGNCQMLVPAAWKGTTSSASPEDRQAMASIHLLPGKDWTESKAMAQSVMAAQEMLENSAERFWFSYPPKTQTLDVAAANGAARPAGAPLAATSKPADAPTAATAKPAGTPPALGAMAPASPAAIDVAWYVSVPGPLGPCAAQITFRNEALTETARTIATSVASMAPRTE